MGFKRYINALLLFVCMTAKLIMYLVLGAISFIAGIALLLNKITFKFPFPFIELYGIVLLGLAILIVMVGIVSMMVK